MSEDDRVVPFKPKNVGDCDPLQGMFATKDEAVEIASSSFPPRYVARGPRGGFSSLPMGVIPYGMDENGALTLWPLDQLFVYLPPDYAQQDGSAAKGFTREPDLQAEADEALDGLAEHEGGPEE